MLYALLSFEISAQDKNKNTFRERNLQAFLRAKDKVSKDKVYKFE